MINTQKEVGQFETHKTNEERRSFEQLGSLNKPCCWPLQHDTTAKSLSACNRYPHQPPTSPLINLHKEVGHVPLATLSKKWPHSQLNGPFHNPNIASSIHAHMR